VARFGLILKSEVFGTAEAIYFLCINVASMACALFKGNNSSGSSPAGTASYPANTAEQLNYNIIIVTIHFIWVVVKCWRSGTFPEASSL
jgi:hypothetical protein